MYLHIQLALVKSRRPSPSAPTERRHAEQRQRRSRSCSRDSALHLHQPPLRRMAVIRVLHAKTQNLSGQIVKHQARKEKNRIEVASGLFPSS